MKKNCEHASLLSATSAYYNGKLKKFGPSPQGVDWSSGESQALRFEQLLKLFEGRQNFFLNDYGCGYGALIPYLLEQGIQFDYFGFDISESMIEAARAAHGHLPFCAFGSDESKLAVADYTLASGIFNVKLHFDVSVWERYMLDTLNKINRISMRGFAFNVLSNYADPDRMRADLYYADPCKLFEHCRKNYSRHVALLHDYPLYECTVVVRK